MIRKTAIALDNIVFKPLMKLFYPKFTNLYPGDVFYFQLFRRYFFFQKVLRINGSVPWPVDFRSHLIDWKNIQKDDFSYPGGSIGCYINASGGLTIGNNVIIGPNVVIATTNHSLHDHTKKAQTKGVTIGENVWIGAHCSILPGTVIGDNTTIGAGCVVKGSIPSNSVVKPAKPGFTVEAKRPEHVG